MGARRIFFLQKVDDFISRHLKTQVFTVTTNAQNILQHFHGASALKTFHFFEGALAFVEVGACVMAQWPVQACRLVYPPPSI